MKKQALIKRNLFAELMEGVDGMKDRRARKITLRTHFVEAPEIKAPPKAEFFVAARGKFNVSRAVWANMLRVSPRTVEKWEQGGQVSPLAATFVELVASYPDTIERLQKLPRRISRSSRSLRTVASLRNASSAARSNLRPRNSQKTSNGQPTQRSAKIR
jgi:putative transcriptional regulator